MTAGRPSRLLDQLPAIYRQDGTQLAALLAAFEELLFDGHEDASQTRVPGIERELNALPSLFAPLGTDDDARATSDRFLPWLAAWLAFAPHRLVAPERLRHVIAGIVPLYSRRGTRKYLVALLKLCFEEIDDVEVDEHDRAGLQIGRSRLGRDTLLALERPFWFRVEIRLRDDAASPAATSRLEQHIRAVIDFAKPAHTAYELSTAPCKRNN